MRVSAGKSHGPNKEDGAGELDGDRNQDAADEENRERDGSEKRRELLNRGGERGQQRRRILLVHGTQMIQSRDQNPGSATAERWGTWDGGRELSSSPGRGGAT